MIDSIRKRAQEFNRAVAPRGYKSLDYAFEIANDAHQGQVRKYTGDPYIVHPMEVAMIVGEVFPDIEMIMAAYLHDTVEDTDMTLDQISTMFGPSVARLVDGLTDISKPEDGNRKTRKAIDRKHTSETCWRTKTVKLADLLHNTQSIVVHDPNFAAVYMKEKALLLDHLTEGDRTLFIRALALIDVYESTKEC